MIHKQDIHRNLHFSINMQFETKEPYNTRDIGNSVRLYRHNNIIRAATLKPSPCKICTKISITSRIPRKIVGRSRMVIAILVKQNILKVFCSYPILNTIGNESYYDKSNVYSKRSSFSEVHLRLQRRLKDVS